MIGALLAQAGGAAWFVLRGIAAVAVVSLVFCLVLARYFNLWVQAKPTGANVGLFELAGMSFRKVGPNVIVRSVIVAYQAGLMEGDGVTTRALEAHYLSGGNVPNIVRALIAARRAGIPLTFEQAAARDLDGRDLWNEVRERAGTRLGEALDVLEAEEN